MANVKTTETKKEERIMKSVEPIMEKITKRVKVTRANLNQEIFGDLKELKAVVKKAFDNGTRSAGEICQTVAEKPLNYLGKIEKIAGPVNDVREIQAKTIGHLFDLIRTVTDKVDDIAGEIIKKAEKFNFAS